MSCIKKHSVFFFLSFLLSFQTSARTFYVDNLSGYDKNTGLTSSQAWQTMQFINKQTFSAGDTLLFKRGCTWTQGLKVNSAGKENAPIRISAYGTGNAPIIGDSSSSAIEVFAPWIVIDSLQLRNSKNYGVFITKYSSHSIIQNCEIYNCGSGVALQGMYNIVRKNYVHDLKMIVNTSGGDDDYGAVGVWLLNKGNEVCFNRFERCKSSSYDYGADGGVVEWYDNSDSCKVYNNLARDCNSFLEVGKVAISSAVVSYNISINNGSFSIIHLNGTFAASVKNFQIDHNTIVDTITRTTPEWAIIGFDGNATAETFLFRNNIVYIKDFWNVSPADKNGWQFTHKGNLYFFKGSTAQIGFKLDPTEKIADPLFLNVSNGNLNILPNSPAVKSGLILGYQYDYYYTPVPKDSSPDIGAIQHSAKINNNQTGIISKPVLKSKENVYIQKNLLGITRNNQTYDFRGRIIGDQLKKNRIFNHKVLTK